VSRNKFILPGKWLLAFIIVFSLLPFIPTMFKMASVPEGMSYGYYIDENIYLASIKSYSFDYLDPFGPVEVSIFRNPFLASIYMFAFLGLFSRFLSIDAALLLHTFTFIFSIIYFLAAYNLISLFVKNKIKRTYAFLFFVFSAGGLSGLLYIFLGGPIEAAAPTAFQHLLWGAGLSSVAVIYFAGSLAFGYLSMWFFIKGDGKKRILLSSVFLGISMLIYPLFGATVALLIFAYAIFSRDIVKFLKIVPLAAIIASPWVLFVSEYYYYYRSALSYTNPLVFLVHGVFVLPLAAYYFHKKYPEFISEIKQRKTEAFLLIWAAIMLVLAFAPQSLVLVPVQRFIYMTWLPLSIMAFMGLDYISNKVQFRSSLKILTTAVIAISLLTFVLWYPTAFEPPDPYFPEHEIGALMFLRDQPHGIILAGYELSLRAPYFAEKRALRGGGPGFERIPFIGPLEEDYNVFFRQDSTEEERKGILDKYDISYVIFSDEEKSIGNGSFDPSSLNYLEKIYDNDTEVYRVLP